MIEPDAPTLRFPVLDSTNAEAARRAAAGEFGPLWILAEAQTAGRGRRGRSWTGEPGNLFCTYLGATRQPPQQVALLGFAAAVALVETCQALGLPPGRARVKWPNDLLLDGAKAAGVLIESGALGPGGGAAAGCWFALGVGLNLAAAPSGLDQPTASLASLLGAPPAPDQAFAHLRGSLTAWAQRTAAEGFGPLRAAWCVHAAALGETIAVDLDGARRRGRFTELSAQGELVFLPDGEDQPVRIAAGDIYLTHPPA